MTYRIKDWASVFENYRTRELKTLAWVNWPTRQDSETFVELARSAEGHAALGMFGVLVQLAARCPKRGTLADERGDITPDRYAKRYGITSPDASRLWDVLTGCGWLEPIDVPPTAHRRTTDVPPVAHRPRTGGARDCTDRVDGGLDRIGLDRIDDDGGGLSRDDMQKRTAYLYAKPEWAKSWISKRGAEELARLPITIDDVKKVYSEARKMRETLKNPAGYVVAELKRIAEGKA